MSEEEIIEEEINELQDLTGPKESFLHRGISAVIAFCLLDRLIVSLVFIAVTIAGIFVAPFDWNIWDLPRSPVSVDAIPDIGENQQIVFTKWMGRSPQDIEDQITYPLTSALLGLPNVKSIRSFSMFGFSSVYVVFDEDVEFYWSRTRILEKLNSLPTGTLPDGVKPSLGPDATPLGQVFLYTLEGRTPEGKPAGGWDPDELRSIQDWLVRYELMAIAGVAEVASVGGFVKEYQVDIDPDAMRAYNVTLPQIFMALKNSNLDTGARTMEINKVEYVIRGLGLIKSIEDLEDVVIRETENVPVRIKDVARVNLGPGLRRGALDKSGAEAVGGVVVARYGSNPLEVIKNVKAKIEALSFNMPEREVKVEAADGSFIMEKSRVTVVPFYDRTALINETLGTLNRALEEEILVTIIVVIFMLMHLRSSLLISGLLPLSVLICFVAMRLFKIEANIVALSGIAIAIGTMVDMGIVLNENILKHLEQDDGSKTTIKIIYDAAVEVGSAVMTAVLTTIISFLPVFTMQAAEGKLFKPLAYTKTFALISSLLVALTIIPPVACAIFRGRKKAFTWWQEFKPYAWLVLGIILMILLSVPAGFFVAGYGLYGILEKRLSESNHKRASRISNYIIMLIVCYYLTKSWMPLGVELGITRNFISVAVVIGGVLSFFNYFQTIYPSILRWCLHNKAKFLMLPVALIFWGLTIWLGFATTFGFIPKTASVVGAEKFIEQSSPWVWAVHKFPGLGKEFMPDLDEGSFLLMPTTMPHASIGEAMDVLSKQDMAINAIPEVEMAVGKIGRIESSLDPAPISMIETIINYKSEYIVDKDGTRLAYRYDPDKSEVFADKDGMPMPASDGKPYVVQGKFIRKDGRLIIDPSGKPFRQWRPALKTSLNKGRKPWQGIKSPDDIWQEIVRVTEIPGTTSAPKLQPIAARIVMLQSGMRAPMGVKVFGKGKVTLKQLEKVGIEIEKLLKDVPSVKESAVTAERIVGKPYLEIEIDRKAIQRYSLSIVDVQNVIQAAVGGMKVTTTIEGRERYNVQVRYKRELRDTIETLGRILVANKKGVQVPLKELMQDRAVQYRRGPQVIKSEDGGLVTYVLFDKQKGMAEVDVVNDADRYLKSMISSGGLVLPEGVTYKFAGNYENQVRSEKRLMVVLPISLFLIFIILYAQFRRVSTTMLVFTGIAVAWAGGFIMIWLYGESWFMNFTVFDTNIRELFQMHQINLSVAIWVGFLALFGIATDDGVVMATYLDQSFHENKPKSIKEIRETTVAAGTRRIRPCLMTTATTILALLPILTSTGRGSDIMIPMAIPSFGGMVIELVTLFVVPILYCLIKEFSLKANDDQHIKDI